MTRIAALTAATLLLCCGNLLGQSKAAHPLSKAELVLVFISTSECLGNSPEFVLDSAVRALKIQLSERATSWGMNFSAVGVAAEWDVRKGLDYLLKGISSRGQKDFGPWDEVSAGRNWLGVAVSQFVWQDSLSRPTVPQLIILARNVEMGESRVRFSEDLVIRRLPGAKAIQDWARAGAPMPRPHVRQGT